MRRSSIQCQLKSRQKYAEMLPEEATGRNLLIRSGLSAKADSNSGTLFCTVGSVFTIVGADLVGGALNAVNAIRIAEGVKLS